MREESDRPLSIPALDPQILALKQEQVRQLDALSRSREARVGAIVMSVPRTIGRGRFVLSARRAPTSGHEARSPIRVAAITDEYTASMLDGAFEVVQLHPVAWRRQLELFVPDVLLVESAWTGFSGGWRYEVSHRGRRVPDRLGPVLRRCRRLGIPTVFWNKEDPVGFTRFFPAAREFDLIGTTDDRAATWYEAMVPGATVTLAPFVVNPTVHRPVREGPIRHPDKVIFAGSWTNGAYPDRERTLAVLLDAAAEIDALHIYTRRPSQFPRRFQQHICGALEPAEVWSVSKGYAATLNSNSVSESRTMLSRRVVESLGSGVPVISSPTPALAHLFGDVVLPAGSHEEAEASLESVFDPVARAARSADGWRVAHTRYSVDDQFAEMFAMVGVSPPDRRPGEWIIRSESPTVESAARAATRFCGDAAAILRPDPGAASAGVHVVRSPWPTDDIVAERSNAVGRRASQSGVRLDQPTAASTQ